MNDYLLRHAIANVWCNPAQDRQYVYRLAQLTPRYGAIRTWRVNYERYTLPTQKDYWHVYQIGAVLPVLLGLPLKIDVWMSMADLAKTNQVFTDLYVTNGMQFPRFESFVLITKTRNLIVACKINERVHDLEDTDLYLRFYSNAYYQSKRSDVAAKRYIDVKGLRVTTQTELLRFQHECDDLLALKGGYPYYYVNGRFVQAINLTTAMLGDVVEMVLDSSIKRMLEFKVQGLPTFTSVLDACRKYILHYNDPSVQSIDYLDDIDIYLIRPQAQAGRFMGVYYHHNEGDWLRMLTHKDYSLPIDRLDSFVRTHTPDTRNAFDAVRWPLDAWGSMSELTIRVYIRNSGYDRPLIAESNRIQELYKLSDAQVLNAMTGINATNPLWAASALEQCPYVRFMSADPEFVYPITFFRPDEEHPAKTEANNFVGDVYGYHAAAEIMANTPSTVYLDNGYRWADLCFEHWQNATIFEYDSVGLLIDKYYHPGGRKYMVRNTDCVRVEAITGFGGQSLNTEFGMATVTLAKGYNFRVYVSSVWGGVSKGDWQDITEAANRADWGFLDETGDDPKWVWTADPMAWTGAVRQDDTFFLDTLSFNKSSGVVRFSVYSDETHGGVTDYQAMDIPFGHFDVLVRPVGGRYRTLIENLDYKVIWPQVVMNNLEYIGTGDFQVMLRGHGFCTDTLERYPVSEFGFVEYSVLSNDHRYDIHTHKVQRVIIDGHYRDPKSVVYEEQLNGLTITNERNGAPYTIQTPAIVFKDVYTSDKLAREEDDLRDETVCNYMSQFYPTRTRSNNDFIIEPYHVYSAFTNKILHDLRTGTLNPAGIHSGFYSEQDIRTWCKAYDWLAAFDICNTEYDRTHIKVYPHWFGAPVSLPLNQWTFFQRVLKVYLRHVPDIAVFVHLQE